MSEDVPDAVQCDVAQVEVLSGESDQCEVVDLCLRVRVSAMSGALVETVPVRSSHPSASFSAHERGELLRRLPSWQEDIATLRIVRRSVDTPMAT